MRKGRKSERNEVWTGPWVTVARRTLFGAGSSCNCVGAKVAIPQTEARGSVFGTVAMLYGPCTLGCLWLTLQRLQGCGRCGNKRRPVGDAMGGDQLTEGLVSVEVQPEEMDQCAMGPVCRIGEIQTPVRKNAMEDSAPWGCVEVGAGSEW